MGQASSSSSMYNLNPVNYHCPVCKSSGKLPNAGGRFFLINDRQCQCNGCQTLFKKYQFYQEIEPDRRQLLFGC